MFDDDDDHDHVDDDDVDDDDDDDHDDDHDDHHYDNDHDDDAVFETRYSNRSFYLKRIENSKNILHCYDVFVECNEPNQPCQT